MIPKEVLFTTPTKKDSPFPTLANRDNVIRVVISFTQEDRNNTVISKFFVKKKTSKIAISHVRPTVHTFLHIHHFQEKRVETANVPTNMKNCTLSSFFTFGSFCDTKRNLAFSLNISSVVLRDERFFLVIYFDYIFKG